AAQKSEALLIAGRHDDGVPGFGAAQEVAGENRCAGRRATDGTAAREYVVERLLRFRSGIRVHEVPLPASLEPHTTGAREHGGEAIAIGELPVDRVQDDDVLRPGGFARMRAGPIRGVE